MVSYQCDVKATPTAYFLRFLLVNCDELSLYIETQSPASACIRKKIVTFLIISWQTINGSKDRLIVTHEKNVMQMSKDC